MKILLAITLLFFAPNIQAFCQDWSDWDESSCHKGLQFSTKYSDGGCGSKDQLTVKIKNNYDQKFHVSLKVECTDGATKDLGRFVVQPGGTNSNWTCLAKGVKGTKVKFISVVFGEDNWTGKNDAPCDQ